MSEKLIEGRVVESRPELLMLAPVAGGAVETSFVVAAGHGAQPGDRVAIWSGGVVEIVGRLETRPDTRVPGHPDLGHPDAA